MVEFDHLRRRQLFLSFVRSLIRSFFILLLLLCVLMSVADLFARIDELASSSRHHQPVEEKEEGDAWTGEAKQQQQTDRRERREMAERRTTTIPLTPSSCGGFVQLTISHPR